MDLQPTKLSLFHCIFHTSLHSNCVCVSLPLSLPLPSVRVYTSSLWAPGQTLLFIFLSKSNESHMHTHANAHIHTHTHTPLYLRQVNPSFYPHQVTTLVPRSPPFSLVTFPSWHLPPDTPKQREATAKVNRLHAFKHVYTLRVCAHMTLNSLQTELHARTAVHKQGRN